MRAKWTCLTIACTSTADPKQMGTRSTDTIRASGSTTPRQQAGHKTVPDLVATPKIVLATREPSTQDSRVPAVNGRFQAEADVMGFGDLGPVAAIHRRTAGCKLATSAVKTIQRATLVLPAGLLCRTPLWTSRRFHSSQSREDSGLFERTGPTFLVSDKHSVEIPSV